MTSQSIPLSDLESSAAATFNDVGDKYAGRILAMKQQQQSDPNTGQPKFFPSGDPVMLWIITIQPADGSDAVALWAKGGKYVAKTGQGESMLNAIGSAVRAAGANSVDVGGELAVAFTGYGEAKPAQNPPKLFSAQYRPPTPEAATSIPSDDLFS